MAQIDIEELLKQAADKWGYETVQAILREMDTQSIKWEGILRRSIMYEQEGTEITFHAADYGKYVDEGIGVFGPNRQSIRKESIPGIAYHLREWAGSKQLNPWAVATNIYKRGGIKPRPFFKSVIELRLPQLEEAINESYQVYMNNMVEGTTEDVKGQSKVVRGTR